MVVRALFLLLLLPMLLSSSVFPQILTNTKKIHSSLAGFEVITHVLEIIPREMYY